MGMRIDIPRAPGLGLMLDQIHYERYNKRFANDGIHESLTWENVEDSVEAFKKDYIFPEIIAGEKDEKSRFEWLKILPIHSFTQRHFESSEETQNDLFPSVVRILNSEDSSFIQPKNEKSAEDTEI